MLVCLALSYPDVLLKTINLSLRSCLRVLVPPCCVHRDTSELLTPLKSGENLPILMFADIYIYLIHNPSPYTRAVFRYIFTC